MKQNIISIRGARTHNLQNLNIDIPRDQLVLITGLSGSGKSSLAFDTLYAEGQRRYVESLSIYSRQFLSMMDKPDVDSIEGLSPAISIEQKSTSHNPRSTVGTVTEVYDYFRLLYARVGQPRCPTHNIVLNAMTVSEMVDSILSAFADQRIMLLAPVVKQRKGEHLKLFEDLVAKGFVRVIVNDEQFELEDVPALDKNIKHDINVVVDRLRVSAANKERLADSIETSLGLTEGLIIIQSIDSKDELLLSSQFACPECNYSLAQLEPRNFSFNSPLGACKSCDGLGLEQFIVADKIVPYPELSPSQGAILGWDRNSKWHYQMLESIAIHYGFKLATPFAKLSNKLQNIILYGSGKTKINFEMRTDSGNVYRKSMVFEGVIPNYERRYLETDSNLVRDHIKDLVSIKPCSQCKGSRISTEAMHVFVDNKPIYQLTALPIEQLHQYFQDLQLDGVNAIIASKIMQEIRSRIQFLVDVGLGYITLERRADTLSGGEAQRIRLASQIGSGLVGVIYVLDEPSIGLHQRDNNRLLKTLMRLRDLGNSIIVVEHDQEAMELADHIIDVGPRAGVHGGKLIAQGSLDDIKNCKQSITGQFLSGQLKIETNATDGTPAKHFLSIIEAAGNNLKNVSVDIPLSKLVCITGVSGSGKSTLINQTLYPAVANLFNRVNRDIAAVKKIKGTADITNCVNIDQSPIGRTPRSNPATYTGLFGPIRELFAGTEEARSRGYKVGRFSFNIRGGRCEKCEGDGVIKVEMHFLSDVYVLCELCQGKRYNRETLEVQYKGKNIHQILDMTVDVALEFFEAITQVHRRLQTLSDVGLGYIKLGQQATTLSGGEAQRVKLAKELAKRSTGNTLYILDEPTTGLHFYDINLLLQVLMRLRDNGNSVIVIEHNLDVIKSADWIIDLGPEGGSGGGTVVAEGTPQDVAKVATSYTGQFLQKML